MTWRIDPKSGDYQTWPIGKRATDDDYRIVRWSAKDWCLAKGRHGMKVIGHYESPRIAMDAAETL